MKRKILIYLLISIKLSFYSCKDEKQEFIIINGNIKNAKKSFNLSVGYGWEEYEKKIRIDENGNFTDTLKANEGLYYIHDDTNLPIPIYLKPNQSYNLKFDAATFDSEGIIFSGDDIETNNYFVDKRRNKIFFNPYGEGETEEEFRSFLNSIKNNQLERLKNSKLPNGLREFENKTIEYEYLKSLNFYLVINNIDNPSLASQNELQIDYNNEQDYQRYGAYASLLDEYYSLKLGQKEEKIRETIPIYNMYNTVFKDLDSIVPSEYIKNKIIENDGLFYLKKSDNIKMTYQDFKKFYTGKNEVFKENMDDLYLRFTSLKKGTPSPKFIDYKNYKGGTNSLDDFQGQYVYIDLWASWCGNCFYEIPFLKELENEYSNITFVSIANDKEGKWRTAIEKENLTGIQLLATNDSFKKAYGVYGIPRYIFIDPQGNIIDHNAPRPSEDELKKLFDQFDLH